MKRAGLLSCMEKTFTLSPSDLAALVRVKVPILLGLDTQSRVDGVLMGAEALKQCGRKIPAITMLSRAFRDDSMAKAYLYIRFPEAFTKPDYFGLIEAQKIVNSFA